MGKKAKLKKIRREKKGEVKGSDPNNFVGELGKQGYQFEHIQRSPDVPERKVEPQV